MEKLRVGIIGCGGIANGKHMPALSRIKDVEMVAFCDIIEERAEKAAKDYGTSDAKVYIDFNDMLKNEKLDVVHVLTPNREHAPATIASLEAGKHVMCEKPMAKTAEDARAMLDAAKRTGKKLTIGYQNRFRDDSMYLKKLCENDDLGDIYFAKAHAIRRRGVPTWGVFLDEEKQGGGPLIDIGTHSLDLTLWLMDNYKVKSVKGTAFKKLSDQTNTGNPWGDWDPAEFTVEDSAFGFIEMENGATIFLESSWALNITDTSEAQSTLCGTKAGVTTKGKFAMNKIEHGKQVIVEPDLRSGGVAFFDGHKAEAHDIEARMWVDSIINDTEPLTKPEQALVVTEILEAIYESAKTGKQIDF